jgi:prephenate dehydrogenase
MNAQSEARCPIESVAIVGYGLIGASLGLALKARDPLVRVRAIDTSAVVGLPKFAELADEVIAVEDTAAFTRAIAGSELTVLAGPVHIVEQQLPDVLRHGQWVTDCGSTKRGIAAAAQTSTRGSQFVPGHPMAGKTQSGFAQATADLFIGSTWILCPADAAPEAVDKVREVVRFVGASAIEMGVEQHDAAVAITSHLPKLLASLLVTLCNESGADAAIGPSFKSATRVASGDTGIWKDIFSSNSDELAAVAARLGRDLLQLSEQLERGDTTNAVAILEAASRLRR